MAPPTIIESKRLILRELGPENVEGMSRLHADPWVQKYTGEEVITSPEGIREKIREKMQDYRTYGYGRWAAILKEGNQFAGWAGLAYLPEFDQIDIGYRFLPEFWGKGLATEACRAILDYAFNELKLHRIVGIAMKENKASIRVLEKAGMHFEKYAPYFPGQEDLVWFSKHNQHRTEKIPGHTIQS